MRREFAAVCLPVEAIQISLKSTNRFALVSAIRQALRRAGRERREIERFSREALQARDRKSFEEVCGRWARVT
jgi:hypothetical protein